MTTEDFKKLTEQSIADLEKGGLRELIVSGNSAITKEQFEEKAKEIPQGKLKEINSHVERFKDMGKSRRWIKRWVKRKYSITELNFKNL